MQVHKPKVEYKLALQEKPQGSILTYYYKTNNLTRIHWLNTRLIIASDKIRHDRLKQNYGGGNNNIEEGKYENCGGGNKKNWGRILKLWRREIKNEERKYQNCGGGNKQNWGGKRGKKDSLLSLTILIDFFQIAVHLTLFVLNGISCLILLLAIISRVFNQLILVKLFVL